MDEQARRRLAFAVACKKGLAPTSVYSFEAKKHTNMEVGSESMFDHSTRSHFTDSYDYGRKAHWQFTLDRDEFEGFDYGSRHHFSGFVAGRSIQIFDHGEDRYFDYSV